MQTQSTEIAPEVLAQKILDQIEAQPEAFDMRWWMHAPEGRGHIVAALRPDDDLCGTTMCVAGWACRLAGYTLRRGNNIRPARADGSVESVPILAQRLLGLSDTRMFYLYSNAIAKQCLCRIAAGEDFDDLLEGNV